MISKSLTNYDFTKFIANCNIIHDVDSYVGGMICRNKGKLLHGIAAYIGAYTYHFLKNVGVLVLKGIKNVSHVLFW